MLSRGIDKIMRNMGCGVSARVPVGVFAIGDVLFCIHGGVLSLCGAGARCYI
jgi:hypothetical protein